MTSPNPTGVVGTYPISGNGQIDPLVWLGFKWGASGAGTPAVVTYSFPTSTSKWSTDYTTFLDNEPFNGFQAFTASQQAAAKQAMALWSEVANITFKQVTETATNVGDIRFGNSASVTQDPGAAVAWAYTPFEDNDPDVHYPESGDIWFDRQYPFNLQLKPGQEGFWTMLHEIGHAIGLDHPFVDTSDPSEPVLAGQDTDQYTVMSYTLELATNAFASTPQLLDILAIQHIYGANMNTRKGNDVYKFSATSEVNRAIWDAGGIDTLDLSNQTTGSFVSLIDGTHSKFCFQDGKNGPTSSLLGIAFGVTIENAFGGAGNDEIWGNAAGNRLTGGNGLDLLEGLDGADRLEGGAGMDTLVGATGMDFLDGGIGDDEMHGGSAEDTLSGAAGMDSLYGGSGNDLYIIDSSDVIEDGGGDSGDGVQVSFLIKDMFWDIENYKYTGAAAWTFTGDGAANELSGGSAGDKLDGAGGDDPLLGNGGNDTLTGGIGDDALFGGIGTDKMFGGAGNDTYEINVAGDVINEEGSGDSDDLVRSSVTINLASLASGAIEHAVLLGTTALNATGNAQANKLTGNSGANKLNGDSGADTLSGGNGADTYTVDSLGDQVIETTGGAPGGVDIVISSVDFELGANVEKLTLTNLALKGTGNDLGNTITGNIHDNILDGKGGNDILAGGVGNDTYVVDSAKDVVNETVLNKAGGGVDVVQSSVNFSLATRTNIENLTLTGAGDINGTGNALANVIEGNSGRNVLDGGAGADTLRGGAGNDTYVVDSLSDKVDEGANTDTGDEVRSGLLTIGAFAGIENYTYTGTKAWSFTGTADGNKISGSSASDTLNGVDGDDTLLGNGGNDLLIGEAGNDTLDGGTGIDKMMGGAGNDTYVIDNANDKVDEGANVDTGDEVKSSLLIGLFAGIENYTYTGTKAWNFTGTSASNKISGNTASDTLNGADGNDTLAGNGGNDKLAGDLGDDWLDGGAGNDTLKGGAGNDTYQLNDATDIIDEESNADADDLVRAAVNVDLSALAGGRIEHATLTGTANINATGNTANNKLTGNDGANELNGGIGADTLTGGLGNDTYILDAGDQVVEAADGGTDLVKTGLTFSLAALAFVENVTLTGTSDIDATGNGLNNVLTGNDGINRLDGGVGNDTMIGGKGDDTYIVDAAGDVISETVAVGGGTDLVESSVDYSLAAFANVENLTLKGSALNGTGNVLANTIIGTAASNTLDGLAGADTLKGGAGNDTYVLDDAGDVINEEANADADDLVRSSMSVNLTVLAAGLIEHVELLGALAIDATGNAGDNKLTGNSGDNVLDGGSGADTMTGGLGNDTYIADDAGDQIVDTGGIDTVKTDLTFSLASLGAIENLTLTGSSNTNATGNDLDNLLTGNSGANQLFGGLSSDTLDGSGGADTLKGGHGNDTYVVDDVGDVVDEEGNISLSDTLQSSDISLLATTILDIENYTYTGAADWTFTGDSSGNKITGGSGNDVLAGAQGGDTLIGGEGDDILASGGTGTLIGGNGNDTYLVSDTSDTIIEAADGGIDTIVSDFDFDLRSLENIESLTLTEAAGSGFSDAVGTTGDNTLIGNSFNNGLAGIEGNDRLFGGAGNDSLNGWTGDDFLVGGDGADDLQPGSGRDTLDYNHLSEAGDTIGGFEIGAGGDVLDLHDLLVDIGYAGSNPFADGYLIFSNVGNQTQVLVDPDGLGASGSTALTMLFGTLTQADTNNYII